MAKKIAFVADSLDSAHRFQRALSQMDVEVTAGSTAHLRQLIAAHPDCDLVICEMQGRASSSIGEIESLLIGEGVGALLLVVSADDLAELRLPLQLHADFVVAEASAEEYAARVRLMLWPGNEASSSDFIAVDNMTINLATYQVKVNDEAIDLTYLEYALLAFLVTHPGRTYSRDTLLRRVWGFDYYGGSRTVDVHVRRVRAKLGPELAQRLETVRGVGYLWNI